MYGYTYGGAGGAERGPSGGTAARGAMWGAPGSYVGTQMSAAMQHMAPRPLNPAATPQDIANMYRDFAMASPLQPKAPGRGRGGQAPSQVARAQAPSSGFNPTIPQQPAVQKPSRLNYDRAQVLSSLPDAGDRSSQIQERQKVIPIEVAALAPEAEVFSQLVELEKALDAKTQDVLQSLACIREPENGVPQVVRITVCNTHAHQQSAAADASMPANAQQPAWTLHINASIVEEGKASSTGSKKYLDINNLLHRVLVRPHQKEQLHMLGQPEYSWQGGRGSTGHVGFELNQQGPNCDTELELDLFLWFKHSPDRVTSRSKELQNLLGVTTDSRATWTRALWSYIKRKKLHDPSDINFVNFDADLARLLGIPRCGITHLPGCLFGKLEPALPLNIKYRLDLTAKHVRPKATDVVVSMVGAHAESARLFSKELDALDVCIAASIEKAKQTKTKRDFMQAVAQAPQPFLETLFAAQEKELQELKRSLYGRTQIRLALMPEERGQAPWRLGWLEGALVRYDQELTKRGHGSGYAADHALALAAGPGGSGAYGGPQ